MPRSINKQAGLTVIELFIVVALVGLLLSIIMTGLTQAQAQARDARRVLDVEEIQKALNIYYASTQQFPTFTTRVTIDREDDFSHKLLTMGALEQVPLDPIYPVFSYYYISNRNGSDYRITYCLETNSIQGKSKGCNNTLGP